jgi:hypothetical protein
VARAFGRRGSGSPSSGKSRRASSGTRQFPSAQSPPKQRTTRDVCGNGRRDTGRTVRQVSPKMCVNFRRRPPAHARPSLHATRWRAPWLRQAPAKLWSRGRSGSWGLRDFLGSIRLLLARPHRLPLWFTDRVGIRKRGRDARSGRVRQPASGSNYRERLTPGTRGAIKRKPPCRREAWGRQVLGRICQKWQPALSDRGRHPTSSP